MSPEHSIISLAYGGLFSCSERFMSLISLMSQDGTVETLIASTGTTTSRSGSLSEKKSNRSLHDARA